MMIPLGRVLRVVMTLPLILLALGGCPKAEDGFSFFFHPVSGIKKPLFLDLSGIVLGLDPELAEKKLT